MTRPWLQTKNVFATEHTESTEEKLGSEKEHKLQTGHWGETLGPPRLCGLTYIGAEGLTEISQFARLSRINIEVTATLFW